MTHASIAESGPAALIRMTAAVGGKCAVTAKSVALFAQTEPVQHTAGSRRNRLFKESHAMNRYQCKLFNYAHMGLHVEHPRDRNAWKTVPLEPFAVLAVTGANMRDAAAFAYVLACGLDRAIKLRSLNAPEVTI